VLISVSTASEAARTLRDNGGGTNPDLQALISLLSDVDDGIDSAQNILDDVDKNARDKRKDLDDVKKNVGKHGNQSSALFWLPTLWALGCVAALLVSKSCTPCTRVLTLLGTLLVLLVWFWTALLYLVGIASSDFCIAPEGVIVTRLADHSGISDSSLRTVEYYLTCDALPANSPLRPSVLDDAESAKDDINSAMTKLQSLSSSYPTTSPYYRTFETLRDGACPLRVGGGCLCASVVSRLCGCVGVSLCRCVVVSLCRCVVVSLCRMDCS
jgi:hypothetical protein